jgi:hypothetical protein
MAAMTDRDCVQAFVEHLATGPYPGLHIESWPEDLNRSSPEVEALCEGNGVRIAIEHTSVDFVEGQRGVGAQFQACADRLREVLSERLTCRTRVFLPYDTREHGIKWNEACRVILAWLVENLDSLSDDLVMYDVDGLPFKIGVQKASNRPPAFLPSRTAPENPGLYPELDDRLNRKIAKLVRYRGKGYRTILLLQTDDLALMNPGIVEERVATLLDRGGDRPDEVWLIETEIEDDLLFYKLWPTRSS